MNDQSVTSLEHRAIDAVIDTGRGAGYVLDFSNNDFARFFHEHGIDIYDARYEQRGTSKANRLRCFLEVTPPPRSGRVLAALLENRLASTDKALHPDTLARYIAVVDRLGGSPPPGVRAQSREETTEAALLARVFKPEVFGRLPGDPSLHDALQGRMREAQRCIENEAWLSAVILCGSVLEGMCLGFGEARPEVVNRAYAAQFNKAVPRLWEWKLTEWIDVLTRVGAFSPNVGKFGHALRDFRNYVHPREQLAHNFSPDAHTARIGFQVVVASADDLVRFMNEGRP